MMMAAARYVVAVLALAVLVIGPAEGSEAVHSGLSNPPAHSRKPHSVNCSSLCSQKDGDLRCWEKTMHHFNVELMEVMENWVAVKADMDQWRRRQLPEKEHKTYIFPFEEVLNKSIRQLERLRDPNRHLRTETIQIVARALVERVNATSTGILISPPTFTCPIPCDYPNRLWSYLFVSSAILNLALILAVVPFIIRAEKRDRERFPS